MSNLKERALHYFSVFSNKKLDELADLLSEDVYLKDWETEASGKEDVLKVNKNIFEAVKTIEIKPVLLLVDGDYVSAHLEILINKEEVVRVLDLLKFNNSQKISRILAFKG